MQKKYKPSQEVVRWTVLKHMLDDLQGVLDYDTAHVDAIRKQFSISGADLLMTLLRMEQDGLVMRDKENTIYVLTDDGLKTLNPDYEPPRVQ